MLLKGCTTWTGMWGGNEVVIPATYGGKSPLDVVSKLYLLVFWFSRTSSLTILSVLAEAHTSRNSKNILSVESSHSHFEKPVITELTPVVRMHQVYFQWNTCNLQQQKDVRYICSLQFLKVRCGIWHTAGTTSLVIYTQYQMVTWPVLYLHSWSLYSEIIWSDYFDFRRISKPCFLWMIQPVSRIITGCSLFMYMAGCFSRNVYSSGIMVHMYTLIWLLQLFCQQTLVMEIIDRWIDNGASSAVSDGDLFFDQD